MLPSSAYIDIEVRRGIASVSAGNGGPLLGTAWLCDEAFALTAAHVVGPRAIVELLLETGETVRARPIDRSDGLDVILLKLDAPLAGQPRWPLTMNDDGDIAAGDKLQVVGYAGGWNGLYSFTGPVGSASEVYHRERILSVCVDQEREVLRGMSGGPVLDADNLVVGIDVHYPKAITGVIHVSRLDDVWRALSKWRQLQPDWRSGGKVSTYLADIRSGWQKLTYGLPGGLGPKHDLSAVFVGQRFRDSSKFLRQQSDVQRIPRGGIELLLDQLRNDRRSIVLRGDPGTGKSVLLRRLAIELADRWIRHEHNVDVPVLIHAERLAVATIDEVIAEACKVVRSGVRGLRPLLLVDGLDEVVDIEDRRRVVDRILEHSAAVRMRARPPIRIVLASRPVALLDEIPESDAEQFIVQRWTDAQVHAFAGLWFADDKSRAERFVTALQDARLLELAATPALATVAAVVFQRSRDGRLPSSRGQLYEEFIELAIASRDLALYQRFAHEWDELYPGRGTTISPALWEAREKLSGFVAVAIQAGTLPISGDLSGAALEECIGRGLLPRERAGSPRWFAQHDLINDLLLSSGLFVPTPEGLGFVHNTIREALVARGLSQTLPSCSDEVWHLLKRWTDTRWREVVLLALASWSQQGAELRSLLWSELKPLMTSSPRGLQFVATALGEGLEVDVEAEESIIDALLDRVDQWSPCSELLFATFKSPNPMDVVRTLSRRRSFFDSVVERLKSECGCSTKIWSLLTLAYDVHASDGLLQLLDGAPRVAQGAALLLAQCGSGERILSHLIGLAPSLKDIGAGIHVGKLIGEVADEATLGDLLTNDNISAELRLAAALAVLLTRPSQAGRAIAVLAPQLDLKLEEPAHNQLADQVLSSGLAIDFRALNLETGAVLLTAAFRAELDEPRLLGALQEAVHDAAPLDQGFVGALTALIAFAGNDEDMALARSVAGDTRMTGHERLRLASALVSYGDLHLLSDLANDTELDVRNRCKALVALAGAGRREEAVDRLGRLDSRIDQAASSIADAYYALGLVDRAVSLLLDAVKNGNNAWGVRALMEMGRVTELSQLATDQKISGLHRNFAVRCLGELGAADALLAMASQPAASAVIAIAVARELQALGWHREANQLRAARVDGGKQIPEEAEIIRAAIGDPTTSPEELVALHEETLNEESLIAFKLLYERTDLSPEAAMKMWKDHEESRCTFEMLTSLIVVPLAETGTLMKFVSIAAERGAFVAVHAAMALVLPRPDVFDEPRDLTAALVELADAGRLREASSSHYNVRYRLDLLEAVGQFTARHALAATMLNETSISALDRAKILMKLREWNPGDESIGPRIAALFSSAEIEAFEGEFDFVLDACSLLMEIGEGQSTARSLAAVAEEAGSDSWNDHSNRRRAAAMLLDIGRYDLAAPWFEKLLTESDASRLDKILAAWCIAEQEPGNGLPKLAALIIEDLASDDRDIGARLEGLNALHALGHHEEVIRLAPILWDALAADSGSQAICESYWGRSTWALAGPR